MQLEEQTRYAFKRTRKLLLVNILNACSSPYPGKKYQSEPSIPCLQMSTHLDT